MTAMGRTEIFVVTIVPLSTDGGVGGVEWRVNRKAAEQFLDELARDLNDLNDPNMLTLWRTEVPSELFVLTGRDVTDYVYDGFVTNDPETAVPYTTKLDERTVGVRRVAVSIEWGEGDARWGDVPLHKLDAVLEHLTREFGDPDTIT